MGSNGIFLDFLTNSLRARRRRKPGGSEIQMCALASAAAARADGPFTLRNEGKRGILLWSLMFCSGSVSGYHVNQALDSRPLELPVTDGRIWRS